MQIKHVEGRVVLIDVKVTESEDRLPECSLSLEQAMRIAGYGWSSANKDFQVAVREAMQYNASTVQERINRLELELKTLKEQQNAMR